MAASTSLTVSGPSAVSASGTPCRGYSSSRRLPTSEREVAATSSRLGWRQTRRAASAPVKPVAPATTTRARGSPSSDCAAGSRAVEASLTQRSPDLGEGLANRAAALGHLLVRERSIGSLEGQPQRQALAPLPHLLARVEVEELGAAKQLAAAGVYRRRDGRGLDAAVDDD